MSEFTAKVTRNGQVTIPFELRATQKIDMGDFVRLQLVAVVGKKK